MCQKQERGVYCRGRGGDVILWQRDNRSFLVETAASLATESNLREPETKAGHALSEGTSWRLFFAWRVLLQAAPTRLRIPRRHRHTNPDGKAMSTEKLLCGRGSCRSSPLSLPKTPSGMKIPGWNSKSSFKGLIPGRDSDWKKR